MKIFKKELGIEDVERIIGEHTLVYSDEGNGSHKFNNVAELSEANSHSICFYENEKYLEDFKASEAGLVIVPEDFRKEILSKDKIPCLVSVQKPYFKFMLIVSWWLEQDKKLQTPVISPLASVHPTAKIAPNVNIEPFAVIGENVTIGVGSYIGSHSVLMDNVQIGEVTKIYPNVVIYEDCKIGNKVIIHSGSVIGADGFGYVPMEGFQIKIPQVGNVVIEDDVEIGANTCIDRATIGTTLIKANTKIDNLVQVAHNCRVDEHTILCSQVGLAGNSHIGKSVYLAGQVGVAGHLKIDDNTMVGAQSGVPSSLTTGKYFGYPAIPAFDMKKQMAAMKDLPNIVRYVKKLIKEGDSS
jgi:UDP-3-O-[3-hydroxymyristoyl] glucosamine N-acyltransferase